MFVSVIQQEDRVLKFLLFILAASFLTSCGPSMKARTAGKTAEASAALFGAECNHFDSKEVRLGGRVTTYYENGVLREDQVRLRLTSVDDRFTNSSDVYIQFYRWRVNENGSSELDSTPLQFVLEKGSSGTSPFTESMTSINVTQLVSYRQSAGIPGTTVQDFFDQVVVSVKGVDYNWHVLKAVLYDGTQPLGQADLLLPIFAANPNTFAETHASVLHALHPFWNARGLKITDDEWVTRSKSFCF